MFTDLLRIFRDFTNVSFADCNLFVQDYSEQDPQSAQVSE